MKTVVTSLVLLSLFTGFPAPVDGQLWCVLTCSQSFSEAEHWAFQEGDIDDWDGGYHEETPYPGVCCWADPSSGCKHPTCGVHQEEEQQQEELEALLAAANAIQSAAADSDVVSIARILREDPHIVINHQRGAVQIVSQCPEPGAPVVAWANFPMPRTQLRQLQVMLAAGEPAGDS